MDLFGLYNVMNENLQQKSNLLATVLEGPEAAGTRYFLGRGGTSGIYRHRRGERRTQNADHRDTAERHL